MGFPIQTTRECVAPLAGNSCPGICFELFPTIATLYADRSKQQDKIAWLKGFNAPYDGMAGIWIFEAASYEVDNGNSVVRCTDTLVTSPGRYIKWS